LDAPLRAAAGMVNWLAANLPSVGRPAARPPRTQNRSTWIDRLQQWATRVFSTEWQSARERELARLMKMLQDDPDRGLKYALPMGTEAGRGIAPPSKQLAPHDVDFRQGAKGGPADYWHVPPEMLKQMTARYHELATREIRLGRHRRAAYIYAELLGDLTSCAAALKSGGYYREAAVVYEERLNRPRDAAQCLEEGGAWDEAIALYEKLNDFQKVGQLYRKIERHDEAEIAYRKAVDERRRHGNLLAAAKLLDEELREPDEALAVLHSGWPGSPQAQQCLCQEFRLLGREGRHDAAGGRVAELREQPLGPERIAALSAVLADLAGEYPDAGVRAHAADITRVVVSRRLVESTKAKVAPDRRLLQAIERLAPEDRLLLRDCERYLRAAETQVLEPARRKSTGTNGPELIHTKRLPPGIEWVRAAGTNGCYFAAGYRDQDLILVQGIWNAIYRPEVRVEWKSPILNRQPVLLSPSPNDEHEIWVHLVNGPPLPSRQLPASDSFPKKLFAQTPPWSERETVAIVRTAHGVSWELSGRGMVDIAAYAPDGEPIYSHQISSDYRTERAQNVPTPLHARAEGAYFVLDNWLVRAGGDQAELWIQQDQTIFGLSGSPPHSRVRLALSFAQGGAVVWRDSSAVRRFGDDLNSPLTAFTISGHLIAVDPYRIEVYRTDRNEVKLHSTVDSPGQPLAVMPVRHSEFAVFDSQGGVHVYRIPA